MLYSWKDVFSRLGCAGASARRSPCPAAHRQAASSSAVCLRQPARRDDARESPGKSEKPVVAQKRRADDAEQKEKKRCFSLLYRKLRWVGRVYRRSLSFYRLWRKRERPQADFSEEGFRRFQKLKGLQRKHEQRGGEKRILTGGKRHRRKDGQQGVSGCHRRKRPGGRAALLDECAAIRQREREHEHLQNRVQRRPSVGRRKLLPAPQAVAQRSVQQRMQRGIA